MNLQNHIQRLNRFEEEAKNTLGMNSSALARSLRHAPLKWFTPILPRVLRNVQSPFSFLERETRKNLNEVQQTLIEIAEVAKVLKNLNNQWQIDVKRAREESWALLQIKTWEQEQLKHFGVTFNPEVENFVTEYFNSLSNESQEKKREYALKHMEDLAKTAEKFFQSLMPVAAVAIESLEAAQQQYIGTVMMLKPTEILMDTAKALTDLNEASLQASSIIQTSLIQSFDAITEAIGGIEELRKRMVASEETQTILIEGAEQIVSRIKGREGM